MVDWGWIGRWEMEVRSMGTGGRYSEVDRKGGGGMKDIYGVDWKRSW